MSRTVYFIAQKVQFFVTIFQELSMISIIFEEN